MSSPKLDFFRRAGYVVTFVGFLFGIQFLALFQQLQKGFIPFLHEPVRVPLSWDMFATRAERCLLEWNPALTATPTGFVKNLRQFAQPFEWDVIYDSLEDYLLVGRLGCALNSSSLVKMGGKPSQIKVNVHCFRPDGNEVDHEFYCS